MRLALTRGSQKVLSEKLALNNTLILIRELDHMHSKFRIRNQLLVVVRLYVGQLGHVRLQCLKNDWLNIVFELFHDILVLQLLNVVIFALHVCVEKAASLEKKINN